MTTLEKHPDFNPAMKIDNMDNGTTKDQSESTGNQTGVETNDSKTSLPVSDNENKDSKTSLPTAATDDDGDEDMGLAFFQEEPKSSSTKAGMVLMIPEAPDFYNNSVIILILSLYYGFISSVKKMDP